MCWKGYQKPWRSSCLYVFLFFQDLFVQIGKLGPFWKRFTAKALWSSCQVKRVAEAFLGEATGVMMLCSDSLHLKKTEMNQFYHLNRKYMHVFILYCISYSILNISRAFFASSLLA